MTLTEMLRNNLALNRSNLAEQELTIIKGTFEKWLKDVGLPDHDTIGKGGYIFSATESTRELLILLVDEPSKAN